MMRPAGLYGSPTNLVVQMVSSKSNTPPVGLTPELSCSGHCANLPYVY